MTAFFALLRIAVLVAVMTVVDAIVFLFSLFSKRPTEEDRKRAAGHNPYHTPFS